MASEAAKALIHRNVQRMKRLEEWSKRDRSFADRAAQGWPSSAGA